MEIFMYSFMVKALIVGCLIGISSAMLGPFLVLRRYSMIGDGLAHVAFAAVAIAVFFDSQPIYFTVPIVILASIVIMQLNDRLMYSDSTIGLLSSFSVALGVMIASTTSGFNVDLSSYLFGSILLIKNSEVILSLLLTIVIIVTIFSSYQDLFVLSYDEEYGEAIGISVKKYNYILSVLVALTVSFGIRIVGTMLISSLIIFPTVSALQLARSFKATIIYAVLISVVSIVLGVIVSYYGNFPTGATIVIVNGFIFIVSYIKTRVIAS